MQAVFSLMVERRIDEHKDFGIELRDDAVSQGGLVPETSPARETVQALLPGAGGRTVDGQRPVEASRDPHHGRYEHFRMAIADHRNGGPVSADEDAIVARPWEAV